MRPNGGQRLRALREILGYRMRDVELASNQIAHRFENEEFAIPPSRLSDIETKGIVPSIFRLYSLAAIYRREYRELLSFYGFDLDDLPADVGHGRPQKSHLLEALNSVKEVRFPTALDPAFSFQKTTDLKRAIERHLVFPLANLVATGQVRLGDFIRVDMIGESKLTFVKEAEGAMVPVLLERYGAAAAMPAVSAAKAARPIVQRKEFGAGSLNENK